MNILNASEHTKSNLEEGPLVHPPKRFRLTENGLWLGRSPPMQSAMPFPTELENSKITEIISPDCLGLSPNQKPCELYPSMSPSGPLSAHAMTSFSPTSTPLITSGQHSSAALEPNRPARTLTQKRRDRKERLLRNLRTRATSTSQWLDAALVVGGANTNIDAVNATVMVTPLPIALKMPLELPKGQHPRYLRNFLFPSHSSLTSPTLLFSLDAAPLPRPPLSVSLNPTIQSTITSNPEIFKIVTPIKVNIFQKLLIDHPNQEFVQSVCDGLRYGFWLWAEFPEDGSFPVTWDESQPT
jgi:hypothetical protein